MIFLFQKFIVLLEVNSQIFSLSSKKYASSLNVITPSSAHLDKLKQVHQIDYINKVEENQLTKDYLRLINLPWSIDYVNDPS